MDNEEKYISKRSDKELIIDFLKGHDDAFAELVRKHRNHIYFQSYSYLHNHADTEEMVQEIILKIYENLDTLENPDKFKGWINVMIKNICFNFLKGRKIEQKAISDYSHESQSPSQSTESDNIRSNIDQQLHHEQILKVISQLPEKYREIAIPHFYEDLTPREIAERLDLNPNTVEVRLHRAKKLILKSIKRIL